MGTHSRFSPSASERETICPGSFLLNEMEPDRQSLDAAHGTAAHHLGELCLKAEQDTEMYAGCTIAVDAKGECRFVHALAPLNEEVERGFEVDDEMVVAVQEYVDRCRILPGEHFVEVRVEHTDWCPERDEFGMELDPQFGTSDHIACIQAGEHPDYPEATLVVTDLKYGKGVQVFAERNKQGAKYALGTWKEYNWQYNFKRVIIRIAQPRLDHFDEWDISVEELLAFGEEIKERLKLVFAPDPPFQASEKGCKFCKVAYKCNALQVHLRDIYAMQFDELTGEPQHDPRLLTDDEIMQAYSAIPLFKIAGDAIEAEVFRRLARGEKAGRKKLVAAHSHRAWVDEVGAKQYMRSQGVDDYKIMPRVMLSPAQAEKLLPSSLHQELARFYTKPPGKPCIVDESDPRPAYRNTAILDAFDFDDGFDDNP